MISIFEKFVNKQDKQIKNEKIKNSEGEKFTSGFESIDSAIAKNGIEKGELNYQSAAEQAEQTENEVMSLEEAQGWAATVWCDKINCDKVMDYDLALSFAKILKYKVNEKINKVNEIFHETFFGQVKQEEAEIMPIEEAIGYAAAAWTKTNCDMDCDLALSFANLLKRKVDEAVASAKIKAARKIFYEAFKDQDFRQGYVANIGMLLYDKYGNDFNFNEDASDILNLIFGK